MGAFEGLPSDEASPTTSSSIEDLQSQLHLIESKTEGPEMGFIVVNDAHLSEALVLAKEIMGKSVVPYNKRCAVIVGTGAAPFSYTYIEAPLVLHVDISPAPLKMVGEKNRAAALGQVIDPEKTAATLGYPYTATKVESELAREQKLLPSEAQDPAVLKKGIEGKTPVYFRADLTDSETMGALAETLRQLGETIVFANFTNVAQYIPSDKREAFCQNLSKLPFSENDAAIVYSTKKLGNPFGLTADQPQAHLVNSLEAYIQIAKSELIP